MAVVTTRMRSVSGRTTTLSGAKLFMAAGTSAIPWPQPTKATWDETERTSCSTRGEKPCARHTAVSASK